MVLLPIITDKTMVLIITDKTMVLIIGNKTMVLSVMINYDYIQSTNEESIKITSVD